MNKFSKIKTKAAAMVTITLASLMSASASAMSAPDDTDSLGGQAYDLFFNQAYDSGFGYIIAGGLIVWGFMGLKTDWKEAAYKGVAGTGVATLPSVLTGLGIVII